MLPTIPEKIVIHLGAPDRDAPNVTETFADYIKNVASSEIYPTWPEEALRANILAQISVALNRVYTGFYRNQGKNFDITNSPAYDIIQKRKNNKKGELIWQDFLTKQTHLPLRSMHIGSKCAEPIFSRWQYSQ